MKIDERNARDAFQRYFRAWNDANPEKAAAIAHHACSAENLPREIENYLNERLQYINDEIRKVNESGEDEQPAAPQPPQSQPPTPPAGYTPAELISAITGENALTHSVSITVPGTSGKDTAATAETIAFWKSYTMKELSAVFGGCTATPGAGAWIDGTGKLISESVIVCTSYAANVTPEDAQHVKRIAETLRAGMEQDAITITIDGASGFIAR